MKHHVWRSASAQRAIESLSPELHEQYEQIELFISVRPYPIADSRIVRPFNIYGRTGFRFLNNAFPFMVIYRVEGDAVTIEMLAAIGDW